MAHLDWIWIPAAIVLESASMAALSGMQRQLVAAGGVNVSIRSMLATTFAANALSVSVPLAGPELGTVFTFRRFTRQGADAPLASWSLLVGGVVSTAAGVLVVVGGGLSSGNLPATIAAAVVGLVAAAALAAAVTAARRPRMRSTLESLAARTLRFWRRLKRRSAEDPGQTVQAWADRLGSLRLPMSGWTAVTGLALANWLTDAAVLAVSVHAAGAAVPWHALLLAYGSGVAAQNLNLTPGGFGITEGALGLTLAAAGLRPSQALAAVLLYRLVSFWLVAAAGWLIFLWLRRHRSLARRRAVGQSATDGAATRHERAADVAGDSAGQGSPGMLRSHELMLLHGQPGSEADWQLVTERLPAQLRVVAADRPGYGSNPRPAAGFAANARAVLHELDARGIQRAVLVGHSYGGGVALATAHLAPHRVEAVVLLASVGPGCVTRWDRLLAAPGAGPLCALVAWRLTPWLARARLALIAWRRNRPLTPDEHVNWQVWAHVSHGHGALWRTFLTEQRALLRELDDLVAGLPSVQAPVLLLADPADRLVPFDTARRLARALPDARLQLVAGGGHHLPRRASDAVADAIAAFMAATDSVESRR